MKQIDKEGIQKILSLRSEGKSYSEISKELNIAKASCHKYGKNIQLSKRDSERIGNKIKLNRKKFAKAYAKEKYIHRPTEFNYKLSRAIAHCLFDGSVTKYSINYTNSSMDLIKLFTKDIRSIYSINPTKITEEMGKNIPKYTVWFHSKRLCSNLFDFSPSYSTSSLESKVPIKIFESSQKSIQEFIRAFWEDEGCITIKGELLGRINSKSIRDSLVKLHHLLGIKSTPYDCSDGAYGIRIKISRENIKKFDNVGFQYAIIVRGKHVGMPKLSLFNKIYKQYLNQ